MIEGDQPADDRLFPDRKSHAMAILQSKTRFLVGEPELLRLGPNRGNLCRRTPGANEFNGGIEVLAASLISIDHGLGGVAHGKAAVITGSVSHVGMENVVVHGIAGTQHAIGKYVR